MPVNFPAMRRQAGDTIIEVMIVLTILGLAISISYATANRSLINTRQAQENSYATELAQSQLEDLRTMVSNQNGQNPDNYIFKGPEFCVDASTSPYQRVNLAGLGPDTDYPRYLPPCVINNLYHISVNWNNASEDNFTVKVIWDDVNGVDQDTVTLDYRLHKP